MNFLEYLAAKRRLFLAGVDANEGDINLDIFEDFYPDKAHFIYELLQNAEDAKATNAEFVLTPGRCSFEHDGCRLFTQENVKAITGIHNSSKRREPDQIGKFGVGFKSVFVYTDAPEIRSGEFSFRIVRHVLPEPLICDEQLGSKTRIDLPFHSRKPEAEAYAEIETGLNQMHDTTLLFLSNLRVIKWRTNKGDAVEIRRLQHTKQHIEIQRLSAGKITQRSNFLRFMEPLSNNPAQHVAVAFVLGTLADESAPSPKEKVGKRFRVLPATPGQVAVFFPAEKEVSGLRFHIHAPFVSELSRASIKATPLNDPLYGQLAGLSAKSLHVIRDMGILNGDFLAVLPNSRDEIRESYKVIRDSIQSEMKNHPLTPTHSKTCAPAKCLYRSSAAWREIISDMDLRALVEHQDDAPPQWALALPQRNSDGDRLIQDLVGNVWSLSSFVDAIRPRPRIGETRDGGINLGDDFGSIF